jgi:hypothetical protein
MYLVTLTSIGVRVTVNEHCACRDAASIAVHATAVVPTLNEVPDAGVQVIDTGDAPPVTVAGGYVTICPLPGTPRVVMFAGHVIVGAGGFCPGSFGLLHADSVSAMATKPQCAIVCRCLRSGTA